MATGEELSRVGFKYIGTPYSVMDCQKFVERCLADCGIKKDLAGSNAWYRFIMAHGWVGSPEECREKYGHIPVGAFLFILKSDGREPEKYKPDGIGNASHIGIYTATGKGAINSSSTHGCVCESNFQGKSIRGGWNRVGLWNVIDYGEGGGGMEVNYQARVVGGALKLRKQPSQNADWVCRIPDGTVITITEEDGEWGRTTYNSESGWVMLKYTEKLEPDPSGDTVTVARADLERMYDQIGEWLGRKG